MYKWHAIYTNLDDSCILIWDDKGISISHLLWCSAQAFYICHLITLVRVVSAFSFNNFGCNSAYIALPVSMITKKVASVMLSKIVPPNQHVLNVIHDVWPFQDFGMFFRSFLLNLYPHVWGFFCMLISTNEHILV